jgi:hypothetical protein
MTAVTVDMGGEGVVRPGAGAAQHYGSGPGLSGGAGPGLSSSPSSANLGDILERILDKGLVIVGDIRVNLLDIELLTIKLRLVIASLETAKEVGIDWWENDPWFSAQGGDHTELARENRELRDRLAELEPAGHSGRTRASRSRRDGSDDD